MSADMNFTMTINGKAVTGTEKFGVENPALGEVFAEAPNCTQAELDEAIAAARAALPAWRKTPSRSARKSCWRLPASLRRTVKSSPAC